MKLTFKNDTFKILQIADTQEGRKVSPDTLGADQRRLGSRGAGSGGIQR